MRRQSPLLMASVALLACSMHSRTHAAAAQGPAAKLEIFATVADLASLARAVGGDEVNVTTMVTGVEDPHFAEARPSFFKALSRADMLLAVGMGLEAGYLDALVQNARNPAVLRGKPGHVIAAEAITPLQPPAGVVSRAMGDVHPAGNPHFLVDPLSGLDVANLIRARLTALRPASAEHFAERYETLRRRVGTALVGRELDDKYDGTKLARLFGPGKLGDFLAGQGDADKLGGWLGLLSPYRDTPVVDDHDIWPYFAERFAIGVVGHLEPLPGLQPTTKHLKKIIEKMDAEGIEVIIASPYYDPRHARFVAEKTGARIAVLTHQTGSTGAARDYVDTIGYNVESLTAAITSGAPAEPDP